MLTIANRVVLQVIKEPADYSSISLLHGKLKWSHANVVAHMRYPKSWPLFVHPCDERFDSLWVLYNQLVK